MYRKQHFSSSTIATDLLVHGRNKLGSSSGSGVPYEVDLPNQEDTAPFHETFRQRGGSDDNATRARMLPEIGTEDLYYPLCLESM